MFSYFGCKSRIVHLYSPPKFDVIIEPFAGSARYACMHGLNRAVWINDNYHVIYEVWKYIQSATVYDIKQLPELKFRDHLDDCTQLSQAEKWLLGYAVNMGVTTPRKSVNGWSARDGEIAKLKSRLLQIVGRIDHWRITNLDYSEVYCTEDCTYFIDPPYQLTIDQYYHSIDDYFYKSLSDHITRLNGQIITCESCGADWLNDFKLLTVSKIRQGMAIEVISERHQ